MRKRLRLSAALIAIGIGIELVTLLWHHPTSFLMFIMLGGAFLLAGIVYYLLALVSSSQN